MSFLKIIPHLLFFFLGIFILPAQQEFSLHFTDEVVQSASTNPAFFPDEKVTVSLPSFLFNFGNSGFSYHQLVRQRANSNEYFLDIDNLISKLARQNDLFVQVNLDLLRFNFRYRRLLLGISVSDRANLSFKYPKTLISLLWNGNGQFLDEELQLGIALNANRYREYCLRIAYKSAKASVGLRLKHLVGLGNIYTQVNDLTILTKAGDYTITAQWDYLVNTAAQDDLTETFSPLTLSGPNTGASIDLGATFQISEKWILNSSLTDLGFINWNADTRQYRSRGEYSFQGIEVSTAIDSDTFSLSPYQDTLEAIFDFEELEEPYQTPLVPKFFLSLNYQIDSRHSLGLLFYSEIFEGLHPALSVALKRRFRYRPGNKFRYVLGVSASWKNRSFANLGLSAAIIRKPFQFYLMGDNILSWLLPKAAIPLGEPDPSQPDDRTRIWIPRSLKNFNLRIGINLLFS